MKTQRSPGVLDVILPVVAIRLAALTMAALIFVTLHPRGAPGGAIAARAPVTSVPTPVEPSAAKVDEELGDMLLHD